MHIKRDIWQFPTVRFFMRVLSISISNRMSMILLYTKYGNSLNNLSSIMLFLPKVTVVSSQRISIKRGSASQWRSLLYFSLNRYRNMMKEVLSKIHVENRGEEQAKDKIPFFVQNVFQRQQAPCLLVRWKATFEGWTWVTWRNSALGLHRKIANESL